MLLLLLLILLLLQVVEGQSEQLVSLLDSAVAQLEGSSMEQEKHRTTSVFLASVHPSITRYTPAPPPPPLLLPQGRAGRCSRQVPRFPPSLALGPRPCQTVLQVMIVVVEEEEEKEKE